MVVLSIKDSYFGTIEDISGDTIDDLIEIDNSRFIVMNNLNHRSRLKIYISTYAVNSYVFNQKSLLGKFKMISNNTNRTCTISAEDSENIRIGNIHSSADQVLSLKGVKDFTTGDIFHFTKNEDEINQTFNDIEKCITIQQLPEEIQNPALELSGNLKKAYLSKDSYNFKKFYLELTNFLSSHTTLYTFAYPVVMSLLNKLSS